MASCGALSHHGRLNSALLSKPWSFDWFKPKSCPSLTGACKSCRSGLAGPAPSQVSKPSRPSQDSAVEATLPGPPLGRAGGR